uniref:DNA-3-methyladenine glycosylase I n=1 Tax=Kalanchoe fedtschenkoi TaxID=63787 RepID=A0A7N0TCQ9_KALFE
MPTRASLIRSLPEKAKRKSGQSFLTKHFNKIYPFVLHRSNLSSSASLSSSLSLSLSQNSNESSAVSDLCSDRGVTFSIQTVAPLKVRKEVHLVPILGKNVQHGQLGSDDHGGELKRCNWITKNSDKVYVQFHDESWGVPVYEDSQLFELLAMSAMLMDYNWTEILKRKQVLREVFCGFDANKVAKMDENLILDSVSNKALMLPESRIRCIVDNAKCILQASALEYLLEPSMTVTLHLLWNCDIVIQVGRECGSFSNYVWEFVSFKPIINRYRHPRNVPLRSPKAETMSKDLLRRGFRFVGPVIVHSFMQAAGLSIDHLVDCYRFSECVKLSERPWRHV